MHVYFCGIGGVGLGPLAEIAKDAGYIVGGSDKHQSTMADQLKEQGIDVSFDQSGDNLAAVHEHLPVDWFVYTSGLVEDHPELVKARVLGLHIAKRDELINEIVISTNMKLLAVAGTHGKTTTTAMLVWTLQQFNIPVSYSVGARLSFGPSGHFDPKSEYFVYECDEFDRNFLNFSPYLSLITSIDYDHPDTYPTRDAYGEAFSQFLMQSQQVIMWAHDLTGYHITPPQFTWCLDDSEALAIALAGAHNRANATLVAKACEYLGIGDATRVNSILEAFPGSSRRFEKLADNLYSDYGHHPAEIAATLQLARELSDHVVLVYQPHQNTRQHTIRSEYPTSMELAEKIYWLPTYLTREDPDLPVLTPEELSAVLTNKDAVTITDVSEQLWHDIEADRAAGKLVLAMGAGPIDSWLREKLGN